MLREYENSRLFVEKCPYIHKYINHFQNNNKNGGKDSPSLKNKRQLFSYKTLKNSSKT